MNEFDKEDDRLAKLMRQAQSGDAAAYVGLLEDITLRLRRVIGRQRPFLKTEDIEDLVQDVLLSMHSVRATYDSHSSLHAMASRDYEKSTCRWSPALFTESGQRG